MGGKNLGRLWKFDSSYCTLLLKNYPFIIFCGHLFDEKRSGKHVFSNCNIFSMFIDVCQFFFQFLTCMFHVAT